jgi:hypothetical protein
LERNHQLAVIKKTKTRRPDAEFNVLVLSLLFCVVSGWGLLHGICSTVALAAF